MKTAQQSPTAFDRMSTHEELHQVLALVSEGAPFLSAEVQGDADEKKTLQEAVAELWRDGALDESGESDTQEDVCHWAEILSGKTESVN